MVCLKEKRKTSKFFLLSYATQILRIHAYFHMMVFNNVEVIIAIFHVYRVLHIPKMNHFDM